MRTVFYEKLEDIRARGSFYWPPNTLRLVVAWLGYFRVEIKLEAFEFWLSIKRMMGFNGIEMASIS